MKPLTPGTALASGGSLFCGPRHGNAVPEKLPRKSALPGRRGQLHPVPQSTLLVSLSRNAPRCGICRGAPQPRRAPTACTSAAVPRDPSRAPTACVSVPKMASPWSPKAYHPQPNPRWVGWVGKNAVWSHVARAKMAMTVAAAQHARSMRKNTHKQL